MTTQPDALALAENLELWPVAHVSNRSLSAAAELRRLHEVNQELLAALQTIRDLYEYETSCGELASRLYDARNISIFAINKAEGGAK